MNIDTAEDASVKGTEAMDAARIDACNVDVASKTPHRIRANRIATIWPLLMAHAICHSKIARDANSTADATRQWPSTTCCQNSTQASLCVFTFKKIS